MLKKSYKYIVLALVLLVSVLGISYAFFEYYGTNKNSSLIFGNIYLKLENGSANLGFTNVFPETKEEARSRTDNVLTFSIKGINTTTNKDIWYQIMLNEGDPVSGKTRFDTKYLVFDLVEIDENNNETTLIDAGSFNDLNSHIIWVNTILHDVTTEINRTYRLRMWLNENVTISDTNPNATYKASEFKNMYASVKVEVFGNFVSKEMPTGHVTYDLSKIGLTNLSKTPIYNGTQGTVTTEVLLPPYELLGWSTTKNGEIEYNPGDTIKPADIINGNLTLYPIVQADFKEAVKPYLQPADTEGNRYLTGDNNTSNYVWYSGKLWRIVAINSDNTIKLVTQGNMATIAWVTSSGNTNYSTSQIYSWLNNEFLPTLEPSVLADSTWDYTTYASSTATKAPSTSFVENEKVGLLTIYDYYKVRNGTPSNFLNNGYYWWTMSPQTDGSGVWYVNSDGYAGYFSPTNPSGARPSVNLKSDIQIKGGAGTKSNPYVIGGDKDTGVTSELLSNRISGEYINFNDVLYRIVGIETINGQKLTKITMADYNLNQNTLTTTLAFGATDDSTGATFTPTAGIGLYLEGWYQANSTSTTYATTYIKDNYKRMIATATEEKVEWYTGPTSGIGRDYTLSKTGTPVSATIGLGYYGEMFSSQFGDGYNSSTTTWLMTKSSSSYVLRVSYGDTASYNSPADSYGVRPSMYLKSDVNIVSGSGMQNDPYILTQ